MSALLQRAIALIARLVPYAENEPLDTARDAREFLAECAIAEALAAAPQPEAGKVDAVERLASALTDAFLGYRLPDDFAPDGGVSFAPIDNPEHPSVRVNCWPTGTNLLNDPQARTMFRRLLNSDKARAALEAAGGQELPLPQSFVDRVARETVDEPPVIGAGITESAARQEADRAELESLRAYRDAREGKRAPVQGFPGGIPWALHMEAYAAYCKRYSKQDALIDLEGRNCRGGFGTSELDTFIPGWRERVSDFDAMRRELIELRARVAATPHPSPAQSEGALTFDAFRSANVTRCAKWHPAGIASWSPSDWLTAVTGELGELASLLKMRNRERDGLPGNKFSPSDKQIADELADVYTYLDLLAVALGVDLGQAAVSKFNEVSERVGFPDRIIVATEG